LTLEDTVEFFNLISELGLTAQEKADLVAFLRTLQESNENRGRTKTVRSLPPAK
jgi:hypothetical protein